MNFLVRDKGAMVGRGGVGVKLETRNMKLETRNLLGRDVRGLQLGGGRGVEPTECCGFGR
jgi:hypothetical protein